MNKDGQLILALRLKRLAKNSRPPQIESTNTYNAVATGYKQGKNCVLSTQPIKTAAEAAGANQGLFRQGLAWTLSGSWRGSWGNRGEVRGEIRVLKPAAWPLRATRKTNWTVLPAEG